MTTLRSLQLLLRPLARFCLRRAWHVQDFLETAKVAFIAEAERELLKCGDTPNVSKIAAMTGIHRRDVMRLFKDEKLIEHPRGLISRIIGQWIGNEEFCTGPGVPVELSLSGTERSFTRLVESISRDLHPGTILKEMERIGVVHCSEQRVVLVRQAHLMKEDAVAAYQHAAADIEDTLEAVEANTSGGRPALHATTQYDNIPAERAEELRAWLLQEGAAFHARARAHFSQFDRDIKVQTGDHGGRVRVVLGTFGLVEAFDEEKK